MIRAKPTEKIPPTEEEQTVRGQIIPAITDPFKKAFGKFKGFFTKDKEKTEEKKEPILQEDPVKTKAESRENIPVFDLNLAQDTQVAKTTPTIFKGKERKKGEALEAELLPGVSEKMFEDMKASGEYDRFDKTARNVIDLGA